MCHRIREAMDRRQSRPRWATSGRPGTGRRNLLWKHHSKRAKHYRKGHKEQVGALSPWSSRQPAKPARSRSRRATADTADSTFCSRTSAARPRSLPMKAALYKFARRSDCADHQTVIHAGREYVNKRRLYDQQRRELFRHLQKGNGRRLSLLRRTTLAALPGRIFIPLQQPLWRRHRRCRARRTRAQGHRREAVDVSKNSLR